MMRWLIFVLSAAALLVVGAVAMRCPRLPAHFAPYVAEWDRPTPPELAKA